MDHEAEFELDLLNNGIDFILRGINEIYEEEELYMESDSILFIEPIAVSAKSYKYIVLHLFSGFLLILKHRLSLHHELSIYDGKIPDIKSKLKKGTFPKTIDYDEILNRLEFGPRFSFSQNDMKTISKMRDFRNRFEHFKVSGNKYDLWQTIMDFLNIIEQFLREQLNAQLEDLTNNTNTLRRMSLIEEVWNRSQIREQERRNTIIRRWKEEMQIKLNQFVYLQEKGTLSLHQDYKDGEESPLLGCPFCWEDTLISGGKFRGICANPECNEVTHITSCSLCGSPAIGFMWDHRLCSDCESYIDHTLNKD